MVKKIVNPDTTSIVTIKFLKGFNVSCRLNDDSDNSVEQVVALAPHQNVMTRVHDFAVLPIEVVVDDTASSTTSQIAVTNGAEALNNHVHSLHRPPMSFAIVLASFLVKHSRSP